MPLLLSPLLNDSIKPATQGKSEISNLYTYKTLQDSVKAYF